MARRTATESRRGSGGQPPQGKRPEKPPAKQVFVAGAVLSLVLGTIWLEPIQSDGLWWHLSRGRAAMQGSFAPSRTLLAVEDAREADWVGGVPIYLVYLVLGSWGLVMLKAAASTAGALWLSRRTAFSAGVAAVSAGAAWTARYDWQGLPVTLDILFLLAGLALADRWRRERRARWIVGFALVLGMWGNSGPRVVVGVFLAAVMAWDAIRQSRARASVGWLVTVAAGCANPRGAFTFIDSLRTTLPLMNVPHEMRHETDWQPLWVDAGTFEFVSFAGLSLLAITQVVWRAECWSSVLVTSGLQAIGWMSRGNAGFAAMGTAYLILEAWRSADAERELTPEVPRYQQAAEASDGKLRREGLAKIYLLAAVVAFLVLDWPRFDQRIGRVLATRLEPGLFRDAIRDVGSDGTAHCVDLRSAGMLCWTMPRGPKPYDVPSRAMLAGRLLAFEAISRDLTIGLRDPYRRTDGEWGGWWTPLEQRNTRLVLTAAENVRLVRALEPTIWKPLSLDAAVLPYGMAGDPNTSPRMVLVVNARQLVDRGPWRYTPHDVETDVRLARQLRAMNLAMGAVRVLDAANRKRTDRRQRREFARCQLELAYGERMATGRAGDWRALVYREIEADGDVPAILTDVLLRPDLVSPPPPPGWDSAIDDYLRGDLEQVSRFFSGDDVMSLYVRLNLAVESGDMDNAVRQLTRLSQQFPEHPLAMAARERLAP